jgi:hypothetical protein
MKKLLATALVFSIALTTGCASIIKGNSDRITVTSLEKDSVIWVDGAPRGRDAVTVDVKKGNPVSLKATKQGCQDVSVETTESFDATSLLGILIDFGIVSIPIDLISGAAWKQSPTTYTVSPICPIAQNS